MACENFTECMNSIGVPEAFAGGFMGALIAIGIVIAVIFSIIVYIYLALGWMTIAKKRKHKYFWLYLASRMEWKHYCIGNLYQYN